MLLSRIEQLFLIVTGILLLTQVVIPLWRGTALFPLFKGRLSAEKHIADALEQKAVSELEKRASEILKPTATQQSAPSGSSQPAATDETKQGGVNG